MSWNGTVRCSWCYEDGHNRNGCPSRKQYIQDSPDGWEARKAQRQTQRRKASLRTCTYCRDTGHNAKTCAVKRDDKNMLARHLIKKRQEIKARMMKSGFGVGALLSVPDRYPRPEIYTGLVTEINWSDSDNCDAVNYCIMNVATGALRWATREILIEEDEKTVVPSNRPELCVKVISMIEKSVIENSFPSNWLSGLIYDEERYFPKGRGRQYWVVDVIS